MSLFQTLFDLEMKANAENGSAVTEVKGQKVACRISKVINNQTGRVKRSAYWVLNDKRISYADLLKKIGA